MSKSINAVWGFGIIGHRRGKLLPKSKRRPSGIVAEASIPIVGFPDPMNLSIKQINSKNVEGIRRQMLKTVNHLCDLCKGAKFF